MEDKQKSELLAAWGASPPAFVYGGTLSSLFTISHSFPITRSAQHTYENKGKAFTINPLIGPRFDVSLDSDFYANKGVLLTEIDTGFGRVEVFSTHLMFGGGLPKAAETIANAATPIGDHISESNPEERFPIQLRQIEELIQFYRVNHRPQNIAIICGDFNIDGSNADKVAQLKNRLAAIGMKDAWADGPFVNNLAGGQTARNDDDETKLQEANFVNVCTELANHSDYCDDTLGPGHAPPPDCVGRFDYIFVEDPQPLHECNVDLSRVRRRQFRRVQDSEGQFFLSDHLGLETTVIVSQK